VAEVEIAQEEVEPEVEQLQEREEAAPGGS